MTAEITLVKTYLSARSRIFAAGIKKQREIEEQERKEREEAKARRRLAAAEPWAISLKAWAEQHAKMASRAEVNEPGKGAKEKKSKGKGPLGRVILEHDVLPIVTMYRAGAGVPEISTALHIGQWTVGEFIRSFCEVDGMVDGVVNANNAGIRAVVADSIHSSGITTDAAAHVYIRRRYYKDDVIAKWLYAIKASCKSMRYEDIAVATGLGVDCVKNRCRKYADQIGVTIERAEPCNGWGDETMSIAAAMWAEGRTTAEIARAIRRTNNAVVGMTHRNRDIFPPRYSGDMEAAE